MAHWLGGNDKQKALESFKAGLGVLDAEEQKDTPEEAAICGEMARLLVNTGEEEAALQWCYKAIEIARRLNLRDVLAQSLQTLALGLPIDKTNKAEILGYLQESLRLSEELGFEDAIARAYINLGSYYSMIPADYLKAKEAYLSGIEYSRKIGSMNYEVFNEAGLALYVLIPLGEWDKALEAATRSLRAGAELGEFQIPKCLVPLALADLLKGNLDKAEEALNRAFPIAETSQWTEILYQCCVALGKLHIEKNDPKKAERYLRKAVEEFSMFGFNPLGEAYFLLLQAYSMGGNLAQAAQVHEGIRKVAEELDEKWGYAFERWGRGLLSISRGDWTDAKSALLKSRELWDQLGHQYNYAKTTLELGNALAKGGEKSEAEKCLREARNIFTRLGAKLDLARSDNALSLT